MPTRSIRSNRRTYAGLQAIIADGAAGHPEPGVIGRDVGPERPAPPPARPHGWEARAADRDRAMAEHMGLLQQTVAHLGGLLALTRAAAAGDVIYSGTRVIPAAGFDTLTWSQNFAALTVSNFSGQAVIVTSEAPLTAGTGPAAGAGVHTIPAGVERTFNLRGAALTVYGLTGASIGLQVFLRPRVPSSSPCRLVNGAPLIATVAPAAGAEVVLNPSPTAPWRVRSLYALLTTSVAVANRQPGLVIATAAGSPLWRQNGQNTLAASLAMALVGDTAGAIGALNTNATANGVPGVVAAASLGVPDAFLPAGATLATSTLNLQAADQWSAVALTYEVLG